MSWFLKLNLTKFLDETLAPCPIRMMHRSITVTVSGVLCNSLAAKWSGESPFYLRNLKKKCFNSCFYPKAYHERKMSLKSIYPYKRDNQRGK